jgi:hypothetical protein
MKQQRYSERTDSNVQWRGNLPLNSESVLESSLPGKQVKKAKVMKRQRPGTIREWISSYVAFEREAKSVTNKYRWFRIPQNKTWTTHSGKHFFKNNKGFERSTILTEPIRKGPPSEWRSSWKPTATDQLNIIKYNIPAVRIDQATVSNVKTKKTTSFEQRKTNVEQMNLEEKQVNI